MAFDGLFTHAMVQELNHTLQNGRVMRISQPYPNEVILTIRAQRKNYPLLLSAHPTYARLQITQQPFTNPPVPTNFTMMLRKYLEGAHLLTIEQVENDRIVNLHFTSRNELGDSLPLILSIEIMGRHSNVILIKQEENKIIDTIKHVGIDQNRYRTLLPGADYIPAPKQEKVNPFKADLDKVENLLKSFPNREVLAQKLQITYQGLAFNSALYLADYLHQHDNQAKAFPDALANLKHAQIVKLNQKLDFTVFNYPETQVVASFESLSMLLDDFYRQKADFDRVMQQGAKLIHTIKTNLSKNRKKLKKLGQELAATQNAEDYRIKGELLTTYLHQVDRSMEQIELPNYYADNQPVKIALSKQLTPSQNAQKYFKRYTKLKNAVAYIEEQSKKTRAEVAYLENLQSQIELASPSDLPDIEAELAQEGYLRLKKQKRQQKHKVAKPAQFKASDGTFISVGKNNLQNDHLSLKVAQKTDWWLHVKDLPGSHVIIHSDQPSEDTLVEAAKIAAYYSKARASANVAVDYLQVKKLRKPNGAKPGYVIYEGQQTLYVTPDEKLIKQLQV